LGAGDAKISEILGCSSREGREAKKRFIEFYPGLKALKDHIIPRDAARGFFYGLDGRAVLCDSKHLMLAGYLQNGEAIVMKTANLIWKRRIEEERLSPYVKQVNFVHDEWQTEVKGDYDLALRVAQIQAASIAEAGRILKVKCPLEGSILNSHKQPSIGRTWADTH
jgi:DNA polymerase I-like protein with 3'-5' exonuclease and polymerase domains